MRQLPAARNLYVRRVDGSNAPPKTTIASFTGRSLFVDRPSGEIALIPPVWSPDGKSIAYFTVTEKDEYSYTYTLHTTGLTLHTNTTGLTNLPRISISDRHQIGSMTTGPNTIPPRPSWSPDGRRIAFLADDGSRRGIFTANADGTDRQRLAHPAEGFANSGIRQVAWSPDGTEILLLSNWIDLVSPDGSNHRRLVLPSTLRRNLGLVAWSPDGSRIAIHNPGQLLVTMNRDGTEHRILYEGNPHPRAGTRVNSNVCSAGIVVPDPEASLGLVQDCETLLTVIEALAGDTPFRWSPDLPITSWEGVITSRGDDDDEGSPVRVRGLSLKLKKLAGSIPPELGDLQALRTLSLSGNRLTGEIPPELGGLANLVILNLSDNPLTGTIPPALGDLTALEWLELSNTSLRGTIPAKLANLTNLHTLDISNNRFTGEIPPELGQLANLEQLDLSGNRLTGAIPLALGDLAALERLDLSNTAVSGTLPPELGNLINLRYVDISHTQMTGCIPSELWETEIRMAGSGMPRCQTASGQ